MEEGGGSALGRIRRSFCSSFFREWQKPRMDPFKFRSSGGGGGGG